jgi:hypothetical protein
MEISQGEERIGWQVQWKIGEGMHEVIGRTAARNDRPPVCWQGSANSSS